ncbi:uncharacterized protein LOC115774572 [Archocentrus centrarchus]|uniref:uncharacterized protein LOC115774572 n=1 Tax=Archocentrus centrarchus TaxID=63155 RepID=UPI0011EA08AE|nr:uncharacterized protein LOC115774572 [Archocentrus centrarchus]
MPGEMGEEVCMHLKLPLVTPESLEVACPRCNCEECWCADPEDAEHVEQHSTEMLGLSDCSSESSDCMEDLDPEPAPQHSDHSESHHFTSASSHPPCPEYLINGTFVTVVLAKLVEHIAANTRSSILNVDLDQLVYGVTRRTMGMLTFALPQRVHSLHISIYKKLCQIFGSKYVLQALMEAGDEEFELEVSKTLISVLKKSKTSKNTFNPGTLSPVPEIQTPEPDGENWSGKASPLPEIETPEPDGEEWSGKASLVPEIETPEPDGEDWSGKASPLPEIETPEPDGEEWSGKASPVPEIQTPEPDGEDWSGKASPVPEGETPEPDAETEALLLLLLLAAVAALGLRSPSVSQEVAPSFADSYRLCRLSKLKSPKPVEGLTLVTADLNLLPAQCEDGGAGIATF